MFRRVSFGRQLLGISVFLAWYGTSMAQLPPVAPVSQPETAPVHSAPRNKIQIASSDHRTLIVARISYDNKDYERAFHSFKSFLPKYWDETQPAEEIILALDQYASCCMQLREYSQTIEALDRLGKWKDTPSIHNRRAHCFESLGRHAAAADEWRRAIAMEPQDVYMRVWLASLLATSPDSQVRNGNEALSLLKGFDSQIKEFPMIAMTIAAAAAEIGDFELAVSKQEEFIQVSENPTHVDKAKKLLELYRNKIRPPFFFDKAEALPEAEIRRTLELGVVVVQVRGRIVHEERVRGYCQFEVVEREHAGTVLDAKGLVLVSASTIGIVPQAEDIVSPGQVSSWLEGPFIDVYLPTTSGQSPKLLGKADIIGLDEATGIGMVRIQPSSSTDALKDLRAIPLPSSDRPRSNKQATYFSLEMEDRGLISKKAEESIAEVVTSNTPPLPPLHHKFTSLTAEENFHSWHRQNSSSHSPIFLSQVVDLQDTQLRIGTPVVNEAGECVAIVAPIISRKRMNRRIGIPASVIDRVSAKLASYGWVDRVSLPFLLSSVAKEIKVDNDTKLLAGIHVTDVLRPEKIYRDFLDQVILSVDGIPTSTTTDWLVAMEKAKARGDETIRCEVTDLSFEVTRTMLLPIQP